MSSGSTTPTGSPSAEQQAPQPVTPAPPVTPAAPPPATDSSPAGAPASSSPTGPLATAAPVTASAAAGRSLSFGQRLRALAWCAPLVALATIAYGAVSMLVSYFDPGGKRQHAIARAWAKELVKIGGLEVRVFGLEHLPIGRPYVMVCNHLSYMDVPVLFSRLPVQFRILARASLFNIPFLGGHLDRAGHLPVAQDNARTSLRSLMRAAEAVQEGLPVFIFPEGGRSMDGEMKAFIPGAFFMAIQAQAPIVPMVLVGTRERLEPHTPNLMRGAVELHILPPVETAGMTRADTERLTADLRTRMLDLYQRRHTGV